MVSSRARLSPLFRSLGAAMLLIWVAALATCSIHCSCGDCESDHPAQGAMAASHSQDSDCPDKDCDCDDSFCHSLHSLTPVSTPGGLIKPGFGLALMLNYFSTSRLVTVAPPEAPTSRQPPDRNRVFMHEVCPGPAFRSLAPPVPA